MEKILSTLGLTLGMLGVVLLFIWGPPQPSFQKYTALAVDDNTEVHDRAEAEEAHYKHMSEIGLGLVGLGYVVQPLALWAPSESKRRARKNAR